MSHLDEKRAPEELVGGGLNMRQVDELIAYPAVRQTPFKFWLSLLIPLTLLSFGAYAIFRMLFYGLGEWGNNAPTYWAFDIVNFVFWVGIAHCGTLVSAMLFLTRQDWRTGIGRIAEAITVFSICTAAIFPTLHVGRPWLVNWFFPVPNAKALWVNFTSPLFWDFCAIMTYATVSTCFWYFAMVPDFAVLRDRAKGFKKLAYSVASLGWLGTASQWRHFEKAYTVVAGICVALVVSVSTIVGGDFATSIVPGWHSTLFPAYFVTGALFAGFAMTQIILLAIRWLYGMENVITTVHLDKMNKVMLTLGMIVFTMYCTEFFISWYSANEFEQFVTLNRAFGPFKWAFWGTMCCNLLLLQLFWFHKFRTSVKWTLLVSIVASFGMWFERHWIIVGSLSRDFLPSSWQYYLPRPVDVCLQIGAFGVFFLLVFLFARFLPVVSIAEVKSVMRGNQPALEHNDKEGH
jgi:Ni/Fe-hydrogenase subunit HybB-like protein